MNRDDKISATLQALKVKFAPFLITIVKRWQCVEAVDMCVFPLITRNNVRKFQESLNILWHISDDILTI